VLIPLRERRRERDKATTKYHITAGQKERVTIAKVRSEQPYV